MTLKECLAAARVEKLVALPEGALASGAAIEGGEEQNRPARTAVSNGSADISRANTGDFASDGDIYPKKPEDSRGQSEIYPRSTRIYPSNPIKLVQDDIVFGDAQGDPEKNDSHTERVGPLGEIRVDAGVLRVDCEEGVGEIGENGPKMEVGAALPPPQRRRDPHLTPGGTLVIPFNSDPKYHWWQGGQSVKQTLAEVWARLEADDGEQLRCPALARSR
jgi:hypothetical protein